MSNANKTQGLLPVSGPISSILICAAIKGLERKAREAVRPGLSVEHRRELLLEGFDAMMIVHRALFGLWGAPPYVKPRDEVTK